MQGATVVAIRPWRRARVPSVVSGTWVGRCARPHPVVASLTRRSPRPSSPGRPGAWRGFRGGSSVRGQDHGPVRALDFASPTRYAVPSDRKEKVGWASGASLACVTAGAICTQRTATSTSSSDQSRCHNSAACARPVTQWRQTSRRPSRALGERSRCVMPDKRRLTPEDAEHFRAPRLTKKHPLQRALLASTLAAAGALASHAPQPVEAQPANPQHTALVTPSLNLESAKGTTATVEQQTDGPFTSTISHLSPGETAPQGAESVVNAIRKVEPHAPITTWQLDNSSSPNNKFTYAFVEQGHNRYLTAENNYLSSKVKAIETKLITLDVVKNNFIKGFKGARFYALSQVDHLKDLRFFHIEILKKGKTMAFPLQEIKGNKQEFILFYGYEKVNANKQDPLAAALHGKVVFSAEPPTATSSNSSPIAR